MLPESDHLEAQALAALPEGYTVLTKGAFAGRGDLWLRPTDNVWIETGAAHWGCQVVNDVQYARREVQ